MKTSYNPLKHTHSIVESPRVKKTYILLPTKLMTYCISAAAHTLPTEETRLLPFSNHDPR
jgi:hypothetical protein